MTEVLRELKERRAVVEQATPPARLAALVALVDAGKLSGSAAQEVFAADLGDRRGAGGGDGAARPRQVSDEVQLVSWVEEVLREHPARRPQLRAGKTQVLGFLVGQVMKRSGGRAEPRRVGELLREALAGVPVEPKA